MLNLHVAVGVLGVIFGLFSFLSNRRHLLSMLLRLEYMVLRLFYLLGGVMVGYFNEDYVMLFYLTIVVCEGVLGLRLIVRISRAWGCDYFSRMRLLRC